MGIKKLLGHNHLFAQAILYTCVITWASLAKFILPVNIKVDGSDKIAHCIAYFVFAIVWFLFLFFSEKRKENFTQSMVKASIFGFFYGGLMEILQMVLTTYRSSDWYDVIANTSGIIFAVILLKVFENKIIKLSKRKSSAE